MINDSVFYLFLSRNESRFLRDGFGVERFY